MTEEEFEAAMACMDIDNEYAEYIMENCGGERMIGNGDELIKAIEDGYLYESFKATKVMQ